MSFSEIVEDWVDQALKQRPHCTDEYKVKNGLVEPFINNVLGFNVFNLKEVIPEHLCAFGPGKTDKVDYAVFLDDKLVMIFECKGGADVTLDKKHVAQLKQYYAACECKGLVGVLTNGIQYQFFADTKHSRQMNTEPFLVIDVTNMGEKDIDLLRRFSKLQFNPDTLTEVITKVQLLKQMKERLSKWLSDPDPVFVRLMAKRKGEGKIGKKKVQEYKPYLKAAIAEYLDEYVAKRLPTAGAPKTQPINEPASTPKGRTIKVAELVNDVRGGMSVSAMSEKYAVTQEKLTELLQQLVSMGHLKSEELPKEDT